MQITDTTGSTASDRARRQMLLLAFGAFIVVFILWQVADNSPLLYPFRLLVTFVHEAGHGVSAILTGGNFISFEVQRSGAGVAATAGGSRFVILQMGYLGAALFGAILLFAANRVKRVQIVAFATGVFFLGVGLLFTRGGGTTLLMGAAIAIGLWALSGVAGRTSERATLFLKIASLVALLITLVLVWGNTALMVGVIAGALLFALGIFGSKQITIFVLNALALIVGFNALNDIIGLWSNQEARLGNTPNDALALANFTNLPVALWIIIWIVLAIAMMAAAVYFGVLRHARQR